MSPILVVLLLVAAKPVATPERFSEFSDALREGAAVDVASAIICEDARIVAEAKKDIREEQDYAKKGGGVVDLHQIHDDQDTMRNADGNASQVKHWFVRVGLKRPACSSPNVKTLRACMDHFEVPGNISWFPIPHACSDLLVDIIKAGIDRVESGK